MFNQIALHSTPAAKIQCPLVRPHQPSLSDALSLSLSQSSQALPIGDRHGIHPDSINVLARKRTATRGNAQAVAFNNFIIRQQGHTAAAFEIRPAAHCSCVKPYTSMDRAAHHSGTFTKGKEGIQIELLRQKCGDNRLKRLKVFVTCRGANFKQ